MKIETPIIALLFGTLLFLGLYTTFMGVANSSNVYDPDTNTTVYDTQGGDTSFYDSFAELNKTVEDTKEIQDEFRQYDLQNEGSLFPFLRISYHTGLLVMDSLGIYNDLLNVMAEVLLIPKEIINVLIAATIIIFLIALLMVLLGRTYAS